MRRILLGALLAGGLSLGLVSPAEAQVAYSVNRGYVGPMGGYQYGSARGYAAPYGGYYARSNGYAVRPGYAPGYGSGYSYSSGYRGYAVGQPAYGYGGYSNTYVGRGPMGGTYYSQRRGFGGFR